MIILHAKKRKKELLVVFEELPKTTFVVYLKDKSKADVKAELKTRFIERMALEVEKTSPNNMSDLVGVDLNA